MKKRKKPAIPKAFKGELAKLHIVPKKSLGQHFLIDPRKVQEILSFASIPPRADVLEIGSGLGVLTKELAENRRLIAVEPDLRLAKHLREKIPSIALIKEDIRKIKLNKIVSTPLYIVGNIPYNISGDILEWLFKWRNLIKKAVLLMQKELAEKVSAEVGGKLYSALSVRCRLLAEVYRGPVVNRESFYPAPKVDSMAVSLNFLKPSPFPGIDWGFFSIALHKIFCHRRQKLLNALKKSCFDKSAIERALEINSISPHCRAQELTPEQLVKLVNSLK